MLLNAGARPRRDQIAQLVAHEAYPGHHTERCRKELVLVEEIHIRRRSELRQERTQVNLRRERVRVERFDPVTQQWLSDEEG